MKPLKFNETIVATTSIIAKKLGVSDITLTQNFNNNRGRYIEGTHYYSLTGKELNLYIENFDVQISAKTRKLYLWTERGAFNHVKSLGTDAAWEAFQVLVDTYFKVKEVQEVIEKPNSFQELSRMEILQMSIEIERERLRLEAEVKAMAPKAEYVDKVLKAVNNFTTTDIADELGMSAKKLNSLLCEKKIQRLHDGRYILYAKYQDKGYTEVRTHQYTRRSDGSVCTNHLTVWTEYGRAFLHSLFNPTLNWNASYANVPAMRF